MRQPFFNCRYVITNREREREKNYFLFSSTIVLVPSHISSCGCEGTAIHRRTPVEPQPVCACVCVCVCVCVCACACKYGLENKRLNKGHGVLQLQRFRLFCML